MKSLLWSRRPHRPGPCPPLPPPRHPHDPRSSHTAVLRTRHAGCHRRALARAVPAAGNARAQRRSGPCPGRFYIKSPAQKKAFPQLSCPRSLSVPLARLVFNMATTASRIARWGYPKVPPFPGPAGPHLSKAQTRPTCCVSFTTVPSIPRRRPGRPGCSPASH